MVVARGLFDHHRRTNNYWMASNAGYHGIGFAYKWIDTRSTLLFSSVQWKRQRLRTLQSFHSDEHHAIELARYREQRAKIFRPTESSGWAFHCCEVVPTRRCLGATRLIIAPSPAEEENHHQATFFRRLEVPGKYNKKLYRASLTWIDFLADPSTRHLLGLHPLLRRQNFRNQRGLYSRHRNRRGLSEQLEQRLLLAHEGTSEHVFALELNFHQKSIIRLLVNFSFSFSPDLVYVGWREAAADRHGEKSHLGNPFSD